MKQQKLYKWLFALLAVGFLASCSVSSYPERSHYPQEQVIYYPETRNIPPGHVNKVYGYQKRRPPRGYRPPTVIIIGDNLAYTDRYGKRYYDNDYGYRYWRNQDGRYYLDNRYTRKHRRW